MQGVCNKTFSGANFRALNLALALKPAVTEDHAYLQRPHVRIDIPQSMVPSSADAGNRYFGASKSVVELPLAP